VTVSFIPAATRVSVRHALGVWAACHAVNLALLGCGPSFEAIQEGNLRFAHCDRLDLDPNIAPSHRLHCWREWRRVYTYGQTRDRVEYAQRRIAEVVSGDTEPTFVLPTGGERRRDTRHDSSVLSPEVPPPAVVAAPATPAAGTPTNGSNTDVDPACRSRCEADQAGCAPGCETRPTGCQPCRPSLEACLNECQSEGL
jgi:hypothetical protein